MFVNRYAPKSGRPDQAQKLVDAHRIGLRIDRDFTYNPNRRNGFHQGTGENAIRNYAIFAPYGDRGSKLFLHGRDMFTPAQAERYYGGDRSPQCFSPEALERVTNTYLHNSFGQRIEDYAFLSDETRLTHYRAVTELYKQQHPEIDFSSLPEMTQENFQPVIRQLMGLLEAGGVDMVTEYYKEMTEANPSKPMLQQAISDNGPARLEHYLAAETIDPRELDAKHRFGDALHAYMEAHQWDWEILENFKAAAEHVPHAGSLRSFLNLGAKYRAEQTLCELANGMQNPYDPRFSDIEHAMANTAVEALDSKILDSLLRDKTPLLFSSTNDATGFHESFQNLEDGTIGKYVYTSAANTHFNDFLLFADRNLDHRNLAPLLQHECEHKMDYNSGQLFAMRRRESLPDMIDHDLQKLLRLKEQLQQPVDSAEGLSTNEILVLAKKRGAIVAQPNVDNIKISLVQDLDALLLQVCNFLPEKDRSRFTDTPHTYPHKVTQWLEIPPVIQVAKKEFGRSFIDTVLPQLSADTERYRNHALTAQHGHDTDSLGR